MLITPVLRFKKINHSLTMLQQKFSLILVKYDQQILIFKIISLFIVLFILRFSQNYDTIFKGVHIVSLMEFTWTYRISNKRLNPTAKISTRH